MILAASIGEAFKSYELTHPIYAKWEDFRKENEKIAPIGLKNQKQTAFNWAW